MIRVFILNNKCINVTSDFDVQRLESLGATEVKDLSVFKGYESFVSPLNTSVDDNGNIIDTQYTPYLEETAIVNVIVRYYLEGIEIEDEEDIFDEVMDDDELYSLVVNFKEYHREEIDRIMQK